jgi:hypothetical protein
MSRFLLHRSLVFWAGLLVLGFIAWAWRDSLRHETVLCYGTYSISHAGSGIGVMRCHPAMVPVVRTGRGLLRDAISPEHQVWASPRLDPPDYLDRSAGASVQDYYVRDAEGMVPRNAAAAHFFELLVGPPGGWGLYLPHWLLLLAVLLPWLGLLAWLARRHRRKSGPGPASPGGIPEAAPEGGGAG